MIDVEKEYEDCLSDSKVQVCRASDQIVLDKKC